MAAQHDDFHSRLVAWLKIILPLVALAILSTLFLFSRLIGGDGVLPYAKVDLEELARQQRLTAPEFTGVTRDGAAVTIRAREARPSAEGRNATIDQVAARYATKPGLTVDLRAETGSLTPDGTLMTLEKGVEIITSTGYRLTAADLSAALDRTVLETVHPVRAEAPFGTLDSGGMRLEPDPRATGSYVLVFNRRVRMLYEPEASK